MTRRTKCNTPQAKTVAPVAPLDDRALAHVQGGLFQLSAAHGDGTRPAGISL